MSIAFTRHAEKGAERERGRWEAEALKMQSMRNKKQRRKRQVVLLMMNSPRF